MEIRRPTFAVTPYGDVDAATLASLRADFDTRTLLELATALEPLSARLAKVGGVRDEVLRLHRMANTVINGAPLSEPAGTTDLWELARELCDELDDWAALLRATSAALRPLAHLQPDHEG
ncbi:Tn3 family transposase post-transcriptional regulator TnpC [Niveibacterium sp. SC-1]|uniref:Tn3 family transposase post-transcriptional regulator TnpC n=1 Tax=Niveibacterium sp. SC-1 TaxID=3135646 RepID=UPI00311FB6B3